MENFTPIFTSILAQKRPKAFAWIEGNASYPNLVGTARFFDTPFQGILISVEVFGLPDLTSPEHSAFYGMHIHEIGDCTPPFDKTGNHFNPTEQPHPNHAGDLPALLGNHGYAWTTFYDHRFSIKDVINRSLVIHRMPDDFISQPSGNSGEKIGCGVIQPVK